MLVGHHGQRGARHRDPLDDGAAMPEQRWKRPAHVHAIQAHQIRRKRAELSRGLDDEILDGAPGEQVDARGAVVDRDAGRCPYERL